MTGRSHISNDNMTYKQKKYELPIGCIRYVIQIIRGDNMLTEKFYEVLKNEGIVTIVTWGEGEPHIVNE